MQLVSYSNSGKLLLINKKKVDNSLLIICIKEPSLICHLCAPVELNDWKLWLIPLWHTVLLSLRSQQRQCPYPVRSLTSIYFTISHKAKPEKNMNNLTIMNSEYWIREASVYGSTSYLWKTEYFQELLLNIHWVIDICTETALQLATTNRIKLTLKYATLLPYTRVNNHNNTVSISSEHWLTMWGALMVTP